MTEEASNLHWIMPFEGISPFSESISSREDLQQRFFFVKFDVIQTNVNRGTQVYLSSCPCKYLFTLIDSATFVLYNTKTTTPLTWPVKYSLRTSPL